MRSEADIPGVVARPPLIYLGFLAVGLVLDYVRPAPLIPDIAQYSLGAALIVLGAVILAAAIRQFRRAGTNVPTNRATTALVADGLYRFSRNPIYIALSLVYAGIGIAADSPCVLGLLLPILVIIRYGVIAREERYLERKSGQEYLRYKVSVRRWV